MKTEIVNRVEKSSLVQIDLEDYLPKKEIIAWDLSQVLFEGLILKEKDFREFVKSNDWTEFQEKIVAIECSTEAIIPSWAYMLLTSSILEAGGEVRFGSSHAVREEMLLEALDRVDFEKYKGGKVIVKGCGSFELSPKVYMKVTKRLRPIVSSLMYGEACSSVPVFKSSK